MLPFEYERYEQIEDGVCIYHNVTMLKSISFDTEKGKYYTHVKYCIDTNILTFYYYEVIMHKFHFVPEYVALEKV